MCGASGASEARLVGVLLDPRVGEDLVEGHPLLRVLHQKLPDEVLRALADLVVRRKLEVHLENSLVGLVVPRCHEGRVTEEELVAQHPEAPHVDLGVVVSPLQHLRRQAEQTHF